MVSKKGLCYYSCCCIQNQSFQTLFRGSPTETKFTTVVQARFYFSLKENNVTCHSVEFRDCIFKKSPMQFQFAEKQAFRKQIVKLNMTISFFLCPKELLYSYIFLYVTSADNIGVFPITFLWYYCILSLHIQSHKRVIPLMIFWNISIL